MRITHHAVRVAALASIRGCEIDAYTTCTRGKQKDEVWRIRGIECIDVFLPLCLRGVAILEVATSVLCRAVSDKNGLPNEGT